MANVQLGAMLTTTRTTNNPTDGGQGVALGSRHVAANGNEFIYVQAGAAIAQYDAVAINEAWSAVPLTKALADAREKIGIAQVAFANTAFGWVMTRGLGRLAVLASCAADVLLYTSATAGSLDDTATDQTLIRGVVLTTARGGTNGDAPCNVIVEPAT
jgi:hypothetical protein